MFFTIKAWGNRFWSDVSHFEGQLLIAELTNRIPIIYWGVDSVYASEKPIIKDAFTMYFYLNQTIQLMILKMRIILFFIKMESRIFT